MTRRAVLRSELTKLATLRLTVATVVATVLGTAGLSWLLTALTARAIDTGNIADAGGLEPRTAFLVVLHYGQIGAVVLGAWAVLQEQDNGVLRTSLVAVPWRGRLYAWKVAAAGLVALGTAVASVAASASVRCLATSCGPRLASGPGTPGDLQVLGGVVLEWTAVALLTAGLAAALRSGLLALGVVLALVLAVSGYLRALWSSARFLPDQAAGELSRLDPAVAGDLGAGRALVVVLAWVGAAVLAGAVSFRRWPT